MTTDPYAPVPWSADPRNPAAGRKIAPVPKGSVAAVLAWVGDDLERAERALDAEIAGLNRTTLVDKLTAMVDE